MIQRDEKHHSQNVSDAKMAIAIAMKDSTFKKKKKVNEIKTVK